MTCCGGGVWGAGVWGAGVWGAGWASPWAIGYPGFVPYAPLGTWGGFWPGYWPNGWVGNFRGGCRC